jgi:hypothetical protein
MQRTSFRLKTCALLLLVTAFAHAGLVVAAVLHTPESGFTAWMGMSLGVGFVLLTVALAVAVAFHRFILLAAVLSVLFAVASFGGIILTITVGFPMFVLFVHVGYAVLLSPTFRLLIAQYFEDRKQRIGHNAKWRVAVTHRDAVSRPFVCSAGFRLKASALLLFLTAFGHAGLVMVSVLHTREYVGSPWLGMLRGAGFVVVAIALAVAVARHRFILLAAGLSGSVAVSSLGGIIVAIAGGFPMLALSVFVGYAALLTPTSALLAAQYCEDRKRRTE